MAEDRSGTEPPGDAAPVAPGAPVLELHAISRRFGAVQALDGVEFTLRAGEIHALLGENGAGKSTLMRIGFGLLRPDAGEVRVRGATVRLHSPTDARRLGIGMVHQHFTSIPALTVAENVALAAGWTPRPDRLRSRIRALSADVGLPLDPDVQVAGLSAGLKQRLEVLQALAADARVLLLDEPTSVLSPLDAEALLELIRGYRARGVSTVLITHKLREALELADRVSVLRRGRLVHTGPVAETSATELAALMLGEAPPPSPARTPTAPGEVRIRAEGLSVARLGSGTGLRDATFSVRAGEVVGLAAVEGNGQRELLRALAGLAEPAGGRLEVTGPVSLVPEDRTTEGQVGEFTLTENLVLSQGRRGPWIHYPWVNWSAARERAAGLIREYDVQAADPDRPAASLSGGNQQRLVIAAALERRPRVLLAENPTRGLDLRAAAEIRGRLQQAAAAGVAVLAHAADLDELLELADRIVVLSGGRLVELDPAASREAVGRAMLGADRLAPGGAR